MSLVEEAVDPTVDSRFVARYGVCVVDASTGKFALAEFSDDRARTRLRTMLTQLPAAEVSIRTTAVSSVLM